MFNSISSFINYFYASPGERILYDLKENPSLSKEIQKKYTKNKELKIDQFLNDLREATLHKRRIKLKNIDFTALDTLNIPSNATHEICKLALKILCDDSHIDKLFSDPAHPLSIPMCSEIMKQKDVLRNLYMDFLLCLSPAERNSKAATEFLKLEFYESHAFIALLKLFPEEERNPSNFGKLAAFCIMILSLCRYDDISKICAAFQSLPKDEIVHTIEIILPLLSVLEKGNPYDSSNWNVHHFHFITDKIALIPKNDRISIITRMTHFLKNQSIEVASQLFEIIYHRFDAYNFPNVDFILEGLPTQNLLNCFSEILDGLGRIRKDQRAEAIQKALPLIKTLRDGSSRARVLLIIHGIPTEELTPEIMGKLSLLIPHFDFSFLKTNIISSAWPLIKNELINLSDNETSVLNLVNKTKSIYALLEGHRGIDNRRIGGVEINYWSEVVQTTAKIIQGNHIDDDTLHILSYLTKKSSDERIDIAEKVIPFIKGISNRDRLAIVKATANIPRNQRMSLMVKAAPALLSISTGEARAKFLETITGLDLDEIDPDNLRSLSFLLNYLPTDIITKESWPLIKATLLYMPEKEIQSACEILKKYKWIGLPRFLIGILCACAQPNGQEAITNESYFQEKNKHIEILMRILLAFVPIPQRKDESVQTILKEFVINNQKSMLTVFDFGPFFEFIQIDPKTFPTFLVILKSLFQIPIQTEMLEALSFVGPNAAHDALFF